MKKPVFVIIDEDGKVVKKGYAPVYCNSEMEAISYAKDNFGWSFARFTIKEMTPSLMLKLGLFLCPCLTLKLRFWL